MIEEGADYKPPPSLLDREGHAAEFTKQQARARYIARLCLQRTEWTLTERQERKLSCIRQHNAAIAQDLARSAKERYSCAEDVRQMLRPALKRDVKFYGQGLGVVSGYDREQIKRILNDKKGG